MKLTRSQKELLAKAPADWGYLPSGVGCTNMTLAVLERNKLIELRLNLTDRLPMGFSIWQWRKVPPHDISETR